MKRKIQLLSIVCFTVMPNFAWAGSGDQRVTEFNRKAISEQFGFIENKGQIIDQNNQFNPDVKFLFPSNGLHMQLRQQGWSYEVIKAEKKEPRISEATGLPEDYGPLNRHQEPEDVIWHIHRIDVELVGSNPCAELVPYEPTPDYINYYTTGTSEEGVTNVHHYKRVVYKDVYPKIDIEFIVTAERGIKYNFIIHPGGDYRDIKMKYDDGTQIPLLQAMQSVLTISTPYGALREEIPHSYQILDNDKQQVNVQYKLLANGLIGMKIIDKLTVGKPLVIDPILIWGTYYGGTGMEYDSGFDGGYSTITVDGVGNIFLTGGTSSSTAMATTGAHDVSLSGVLDVFVIKFSSNGTRQWSTYYGGSGIDDGIGITSDGTNVFVVGATTSTTAIATAGAHQTIWGGTGSSYDGFIVKFNANGIRQWGTYYGGSDLDNCTGIVIDGASNIYVSGRTLSTTAIATAGAYQTIFGGLDDAFMVKFNANGVRQWGTYYGGTAGDYGSDIAKDFIGNVYLTGYTTSTTDIATAGAHQEIYGGSRDAFIVKFNDSGVRQWATYYGGTSQDKGEGMTTDLSGNVYVTGETFSLTGIATTGAHQTIRSGSSDAYLVKLNTNGVRQWGTYYGGTGSEGGNSCSIDGNGNVYLGGRTSSTTAISTTGVHQTNYGGGSYDAFLVQFNSSGVRQWGTYYGGADSDVAYSCSADGNGNVYLSGWTSSTTAISSTSAHQTTYGGGYDAFLAKFDEGGTTTISTVQINNFIPNNSSFSHPKILWSGNISQPADTIKICADGSTATELIFINNSAIDSSNIRFWIASDPYGNDSEVSGYFINYKVSGDTITAKYVHPKYLQAAYKPSRPDSIKIVDYTNPVPPIFTIPIAIYRAPVLMVHGLWGNGGNGGSFQVMKDSMDASGYYPSELTMRADYSQNDSNARSFLVNRNVVPSRITNLLTAVRARNYSAGKVDVLGHSMGGNISRYYLQSNSYSVRNDIHELITLNTPHSGSQLANLLINPNPVPVLIRLFIEVCPNNCGFFGPTFLGAVDDLAVNSNAMKLLNQSTLNNSIVPSHCIITTKNVQLINSSGEYLIYSLAATLLNMDVDAVVDHIFLFEENDLVVSVSSQSGGLDASATSNYPNQFHIGTANDTAVISEVITALSLSPSDTYFDQNGFSPITNYSLYKLQQDSSQLELQDSSIIINYPLHSQSYNHGDTIPINISLTNGINRIIFGGVNPPDNNLSFKDTLLSNSILNLEYVVPDNAFRIIKFLAFGFDSNDVIDFDTVTININLSATLDSLVLDQDTIYVQEDNAISLLATGYFDDGNVYDISLLLSNIQGQIADTVIADYSSSSNLIRGKQLGMTELQISCLGQIESIPIVVIPKDTFICSDCDLITSGIITTEQGTPIKTVTVNLSGQRTDKATSSNVGFYYFDLFKDGNYNVTPSKNEDTITNNGISTLDIILIQRQILAIDSLSSPYKIIAADVNNTSTVTTLDIVLIRGVVLQANRTFPNGRLWAFVPHDYVFQNPQNPFPYPSNRTYTNITEMQTSQNFIGMKLGDVNNSWDPNIARLGAVDDMRFMMDEYNVMPDDEIAIPIKVKDFKSISGYQFTLSWNPEVLTLLDVNNKSLSGYYGTHKISEGYLTTSWYDEMAKDITLNDDDPVFELKFKVIGAIGTESAIKIGSEMTVSEAYNENLDLLDIVPQNGMVKVRDRSTVVSHQTSDVSLTIQPNPFSNTTNIIFSIPQDETVTLFIYDILGREVKRMKADYKAGEHQVEWAGDDEAGNVLSKGLYHIRMIAGDNTLSKKVIMMK